MDVIQVEEKGFYVRLVCNKGVGVAPSLYKSLGSLRSFQVQNSNLSSPSPDRYLLTYALDVKQPSLSLSTFFFFFWFLQVPDIRLLITKFACLLVTGDMFRTELELA